MTKIEGKPGYCYYGYCDTLILYSLTSGVSYVQRDATGLYFKSRQNSIRKVASKLFGLPPEADKTNYNGDEQYQYNGRQSCYQGNGHN